MCMRKNEKKKQKKKLFSAHTGDLNPSGMSRLLLGGVHTDSALSIAQRRVNYP